MILTIKPVRAFSGAETAISVDGETITIDGADYDLSGIAEGEQAVWSAEGVFAGPVEREGGELLVPVLFRYRGGVADQPEIAPITITEGDLPDPIARG